MTSMILGASRCRRQLMTDGGQPWMWKFGDHLRRAVNGMLRHCNRPPMPTSYHPATGVGVRYHSLLSRSWTGRFEAPVTRYRSRGFHATAGGCLSLLLSITKCDDDDDDDPAITDIGTRHKSISRPEPGTGYVTTTPVLLPRFRAMACMRATGAHTLSFVPAG